MKPAPCITAVLTGGTTWEPRNGVMRPVVVEVLVTHDAAHPACVHLNDCSRELPPSTAASHPMSDNGRTPNQERDQ